MQNDELLKYIKSEIVKGTSREEIINSLIKAGWQSNVATQALSAISSPASATITFPQSSNTTATEKDYPITKLWLFKAPIILTLISLVAIIFGYYFPYFLIALPFYLITNPFIRANFHYSIEDKFFVVKQGVLSKKQRNIPYGVIQNVLVKQDLFDKIFNLASFSVENASQVNNRGFLSGLKTNRQGETFGSSGNKVNIPGLKKKDAENLRLVLLQKMKENPNQDIQSGL